MARNDGPESSAVETRGAWPFVLVKSIGYLSLAVGLLSCGAVTIAHGQESGEINPGFAYHRTVTLAPGGANPRIVVTQFFTHGQLHGSGQNLAVFDAKHQLVPWRLLQVGPDDFCRLAFQVKPKEHLYTIKYGGDPAPVASPPWTASTGLLVETHHWNACDLHSLSSVRHAIAVSKSYGSDYVPSVFHRYNPLEPAREPFLSVYRGTLFIETPGRYVFFTSSQDCSFLLVDDREVVAAPGAHGPVGDARIRGEIELTKRGPHRFEYVHAAAGPEACMVAAWQPPNSAKPEPIPPESFGSDLVVRLPAAGPWAATGSRLHDFSIDVLGEVAFHEEQPPLVRVKFHSLSGSATGKVHWIFGDGQTSSQPDPVHVYLHPGIYPVKLSSPGEPARLAARNRVEIGRAVALKEPSAQADMLSAYVAVLEKYDVGSLDPPGVLQLVRASEAAGQLARAAKAGHEALLAGTMAGDETSAHALATCLVPMLRDRLDRPADARAVWQATSRTVHRHLWKAECELEAADISLNDLLDAAKAKDFLHSAGSRLEQASDPVLQARFERLRGDLSARAGDGPSAVAAYREAEESRRSQKPVVEQAAWRGAFSRSTEAYLHDRAWQQAIAELRRWQEECPGDKAEGYLSLLLARYWAGRERWEPAIAMANDLIVSNPESIYAGQLVLLAAECDVKVGRRDHAVERLKRFLADSPGSPQTLDARDMLARLNAGEPGGLKDSKKK